MLVLVLVLGLVLVPPNRPSQVAPQLVLAECPIRKKVPMVLPMRHRLPVARLPAVWTNRCLHFARLAESTSHQIEEFPSRMSRQPVGLLVVFPNPRHQQVVALRL